MKVVPFHLPFDTDSVGFFFLSYLSLVMRSVPQWTLLQCQYAYELCITLVDFKRWSSISERHQGISVWIAHYSCKENHRYKHSLLTTTKNSSNAMINYYHKYTHRKSVRMWRLCVERPKRVLKINCAPFTNGWTGLDCIKAIIPFVKGGNEIPPHLS